MPKKQNRKKRQKENAQPRGSTSPYNADISSSILFLSK
jgi:hypothetical protein